jgi:signal peptidase I
MEPAYHENDYVVTYTGPTLTSFRSGDVIILRRDGYSLIKRIIGKPGSKISSTTGGLMIGTKFIPHDSVYFTLSAVYETEQRNVDSSYLKHLLNGLRLEITDEDSTASLTLPAEYYFLVGDNYDSSMDSRFFGIVHQDQLVGKVMFKI